MAWLASKARSAPLVRSLTVPRGLRAEMVSSDSSWGVGHVALPRLRASAEIRPLDGNGNLVGGDDAATQARAILEAAGATSADVLKVIVYLTDIGDQAVINPAH